MAVGMGVGKTSGNGARCFVWEVWKRHPCLAVSDRITSQVKRNGDQIVEMEVTKPSSQLNLGSLQQLGRLTPGGL